ncbi:MAG: type II toxin-antitoxin system RelB/DinJ family antitoxin [Lachnospiraceae bacterium]|nr:type II toxin-antitoxin system RelB/DinJ family antitoxin [Lachnospiraceae bacterium]
MAEQVLNQFRSDKTLREDCVAIYEAMGMDLNTAFRMFMERTRMVRGLPFPAVLPQKQMTKAEARKAIDDIRSEAESFPEMSLEEINDEIRAARAERRKRKTKK